MFGATDDSADIAILVRIVFSIARDRTQEESGVQILFLVSSRSIDGY